MAFLTTIAQNASLNARLTGGASITNAELYMGLTTSNPGAAGSVTNEPTSTGSYARKALGATGTTICAAATNGTLTNGNGAITFATSSAAWSTGATNLTYWFAATSATIGAGTVLMYGALTSGIAVNAANLAPSFAVGDLDLDATGW